MIRTQVQLPQEQHARLRHRAALLHKSVAQQIREALTLYFEYTTPSKTRSIRDVAGKFGPLPMDDLKDHDRGFAEAILSSKRKNYTK